MGLLDGKICLVTGADGGIGREVCKKFIAEGASAVVATEFREGGVAEWIEQTDSDKIHPIQVDLRDDNDLKKLIVFSRKNFGRIDVLVRFGRAHV